MADDKILREPLDGDELAQVAGGVQIRARALAAASVGTTPEDIEKYKSMLVSLKASGWDKDKVIAFVTPYVTAEELALVIAYLDENWDNI